MCAVSFEEQDECQRCMECLETIHQCCLFQDQSYQRIPVCLACQQASGSTDPLPPLPPPEFSHKRRMVWKTNQWIHESKLTYLKKIILQPNYKRRDLCHVNFMEWIISLEIQSANFVRRLWDPCTSSQSQVWHADR